MKDCLHKGLFKLRVMGVFVSEIGYLDVPCLYWYHDLFRIERKIWRIVVLSSADSSHLLEEERNGLDVAISYAESSKPVLIHSTTLFS